MTARKYPVKDKPNGTVIEFAAKLDTTYNYITHILHTNNWSIYDVDLKSKVISVMRPNRNLISKKTKEFGCKTSHLKNWLRSQGISAYDENLLEKINEFPDRKREINQDCFARIIEKHGWKKSNINMFIRQHGYNRKTPNLEQIILDFLKEHPESKIIRSNI